MHTEQPGDWPVQQALDLSIAQSTGDLPNLIQEQTRTGTAPTDCTTRTGPRRRRCTPLDITLAKHLLHLDSAAVGALHGSFDAPVATSGRKVEELLDPKVPYIQKT